MTSYYDWDTTSMVDGELRLRIVATCSQGDSTLHRELEMIQLDNSPPVITDLKSSPFPLLSSIISLVMITVVIRKIKKDRIRE